MAEDNELNAIATINLALEGMDAEAINRVLSYVYSRNGLSIAQTSRTEDHGAIESASFVDLYDSINPTKDVDKALVAGYWLQVAQPQENFTGQQVNSLLKDLGHGLGNVTDSLNSLQARKPSEVRQVSKSGKSKQARKTYKLTQAGIAKVKSWLSSGEA